MPTRKRGKLEPIRTIKVRTDEIFVAKNRSSEPYIKSFIAAPENVAQENLGTLVGVFSVSDHSESSGFVVNILVSAVRKEYFANPRRGAVESFEAALHKMNVALSELVKNGQTSWIGELHGAVAAIEKHSLHFSVTGSGRILLFRTDTLSDISEGLASEEASTHPLKTFVEISSGRINPDDSILLASPEVFGLFSDGELERSARRLVPEKKFFRFLETAMTNELRHGCAVMLSAEEHEEEVPVEKTVPRESRSRPEKIRNAFSADTFKQVAEERAEIFLKDEPAVTVSPTPDSRGRFGDIYVQGEEPENREEHPAITKFRWIAEDATLRVRNLRHRLKEGLRQRWEMIAVSISGSIRSSLLKTRRSLSSSMRHKEKREENPTKIPVERTQVTEPPTVAEPELTRPEIHVPKFRLPNVSIPRIRLPSAGIGRTRRFVSELLFGTLVPVSKTAAHSTMRVIGVTTRRTGSTFISMKNAFFALPVKRQLITASAIAFALTAGGILIWNNLTGKDTAPDPIVITEAPAPAFPPTDEPGAVFASPEAVTEAAESVISPVFLKDSLYLVTGSGVLDTGSGSFFPAPSGIDIRYAAGMDDINLIFLMTKEGRLFAFAPSNRSFTENVLRLPEGSRPGGIGTFLTYLYVLEEGTGRVYRFPRAEGGFGDGVTWTKEPMSSETRAIAISENVYGATTTGIQTFFRGKALASFSAGATATPITITAICANEEAPDRFAVVDSTSKRIVLYGSDGRLTTQYFHESFKDASACALSRDGNAVAVSIGKDAALIRLTQ